jgi:hypothetical protein
MAKVGAQRASELTGVSKSTIQRAMTSGKLSFEMDANNRRVIDVSELERVFGLKSQTEEESSDAAGGNAVEAELKKAADMIEAERNKMRLKMLEDKVEMLETQLEDMRTQRDQWQKQAQQVLLTSQYSQKQAEDLQSKLEARDRKDAQRRKQLLEAKMKRLRGENENQQAETASSSSQTARPAQQQRPAQLNRPSQRPAAEDKQSAFGFLRRFQKAS